MTATTEDLVVREIAPEDEAGLLQLLTASLAGGPTGTRSSEFFRWKHVHNPFGRSPGLVAESDGVLVGVRLLMPWRFTLAGRPVPAVRMVDTATHPEHQGKGIFRRLTMDGLGLVRDAALAFNTPNGSSLPGYLKMGWNRVADVPISVRPVRPMRFLSGMASAARRDPVAATSGLPGSGLPTAEQAFEDLPALRDLVTAAYDDSTTQRLRTDVDVDYLRWRYAEAPGLDYRCLPLVEDGELVALAFGRPRLRGRLAEFTLSEAITRAGDRRGMRRLLRRVARHCGTDHVATHVAGIQVPSAVAAGYWRVPGLGMTLVANPRQALPLDVHDWRSWQLSLGDLEVF